ncbi:hypothetical protein ABPG77_007099 [Micractinium sp. CCAP 211/92]
MPTPPSSVCCMQRMLGWGRPSQQPASQPADAASLFRPHRATLCLTSPPTKTPVPLGRQTRRLKVKIPAAPAVPLHSFLSLACLAPTLISCLLRRHPELRC